MNRIRSLRENMGWTQAELGEKLNVKAAAISKYEKGDVSLTDETLRQLSRIFNASVDFIICISDDPTPIRDVDQDLHDEHDYHKELDAFLNDDEMSSMFYDYKNWSEEEKRNLLNILKGQEALRQMNKKK